MWKRRHLLSDRSALDIISKLQGSFFFMVVSYSLHSSCLMSSIASLRRLLGSSSATCLLSWVGLLRSLVPCSSLPQLRLCWWEWGPARRLFPQRTSEPSLKLSYSVVSVCGSDWSEDCMGVMSQTSQLGFCNRKNCRTKSYRMKKFG